MVLWKRILFLFSLFALFLGALWYPFRTTLTERYYVLAYGKGDRVYLRAAEGENGLICAASRDGADRVLSAEKRTDGLELRFFNQQGDVLGDWFAPFPDAALKGELCALYPVDLQTAFLAFWQDGDGGNQELCVYRAGKNSVPELLLTQRGSGSSPVHQRESLQISSFSRSLNEVFFVLFQNDNAVSYVCPIAGGGVQKKEEQVRGSGDIVSAAALPNGSLVLAGEGFLNVPGRTNTGVSAGQKISHLTCMASGIYFVEDHTLSVWYSDLTGSSTQALLSLDTVATGHRITSLTLTPAGEALLLMNGSSLSLVRSGGVTDLTSVLYPSWSNSLLAVLFHVLGAVFLAFLVWQVFSIVAQSRIPLSLYWGTVVLALTLVISVAAHVSILLYANRYTTLKHHSELFGSVVGMAMREDSRDAAPLPGGGTVSRHAYSADFLARRMEAMLQDAGVMNTGEVQNFHAAAAYREGQIWVLEDGTRAELNPWFHPLLAEWADTFSGVTYIQEGDRFFYCRTLGDGTVCASANFMEDPDMAMAGIGAQDVVYGCIVLAAVLMAVLFLINLDVRRLADGMERYADNSEWVPVRLRSGDELEGMAASLNALANGRAKAEAERDKLVASYRRFVPEPVIGLLGKRSVLDVSKESFAVRNMTVMAVSFTFPDSMYTDQGNTRLLFESVNQVIERTASIAAQKNGTVFNFNYDGYDVVFENTKQAVSAAVAMGQEALALSERRGAEGLSAVTLRIALDTGSVVIGIVGDGSHLEQTTISSRFAAVRSFLRLCEKLDAHILCTESVTTSADGYGSRYVGKCRVGKDTQRLYEIFDADALGIRTQKASTLRQFSQAVLSLYSGDTAQAKRTFLELAHKTPNDSGARYYLYLADRLEQNPDLPCELDTN